MTDVLVLDDDPGVLHAVSHWLKVSGARVVACSEIEAAEALLDHGRYDAVVTDLNVSERGGLEGMRLVRYVTAQFPQTTVLVMSAMTNEHVMELGLAMGAKAVLPKPIDFRRLCELARGEKMEPGKDGCVVQFPRLDEVLGSKLIRAALQPIVAVGEAQAPFAAHAVEALARMPQGSPLANPEVLFSYACRKDRVLDLDRCCMTAALQEARFLPEPALLFINAHPRSISHPQFADIADAMVREAGFAPQRIVFELTEQQAIVNPAGFARSLETLRALGFRVALDDYGAGFANLHLVRELKPDYLKLSGEFCVGLGADRDAQVIVLCVVEMARRLGFPLIMERVETPEEFQAVRALGVPFAQGYFFARPAPFESLLAEGRVRFGV